jgi:hypothetical protein
VEDTRNWELMPSIGGLRTSVGDLTKMIPVEAGVLQKQAEILSALCSKDGVSADTGMSVVSGLPYSMAIRNGLTGRKCQRLTRDFIPLLQRSSSESS